MIEQCPINLECSVVHTLDLGSHSLFVGRIEETYIAEDCLTDGKPDVNKVKPFIYTTGQEWYHPLGKMMAKAFSVGREIGEVK
jgi:flavin reductase (DIM6/NTAB) family NADH-FMN oxidoreductase RutF